MCKVVIKPNNKSYLEDIALIAKQDGAYGAYLVVDKESRIVRAVGCVYADYGVEYEIVKAADVTEIVIPIKKIGDWDNFRDDDDDDDDDE